MTVSPQQKRSIRTTVLVLCGVMALLVGMFVHQFVNPSKLDPEWLRLHGTVLFDTPRSFDPPRLVDQDGAAFDGSAFQGQWNLVFFGFTFCPDICPTTLGLLGQVEQAMRGDDATAGFRTFLVSVDPARDTPAVLLPYVRHFSEDFTGLTGEFLDVHRFASQLNVPFRKNLSEDGSYTVDHGANLMLLNPQGHFAGYVMPPFDKQRLIELLRVLAKRTD